MNTPHTNSPPSSATVQFVPANDPPAPLPVFVTRVTLPSWLGARSLPELAGYFNLMQSTGRLR